MILRRLDRYLTFYSQQSMWKSTISHRLPPAPYVLWELLPDAPFFSFLSGERRNSVIAALHLRFRLRLSPRPPLTLPPNPPHRKEHQQHPDQNHRPAADRKH